MRTQRLRQWRNGPDGPPLREPRARGAPARAVLAAVGFGSPGKICPLAPAVSAAAEARYIAIT
jgi:hypothetical protein